MVALGKKKKNFMKAQTTQQTYSMRKARSGLRKMQRECANRPTPAADT
jgi:hypothetical protein